MKNYEYSQGLLPDKNYTLIQGNNYNLIEKDSWDVLVEGTYPTTFTFYGSSIMDMKPVKRIHISSSLDSNKWRHTGAKSPFIHIHYTDGGILQEDGQFNNHEVKYCGKENLVGVRNGFELKIVDQFDKEIWFTGPYHLEIAFFIN